MADENHTLEEQQSAAEQTTAEEKPKKEKPVTESKVEEKAEKAEATPLSELTEETKEPAPPQLSEIDQLKEENFRLRTQITARNIGFRTDVIEDAVILAEFIVKCDGLDIEKALQTVAKKYPDWKADSDGKSKGGFKIGADRPNAKVNSSDKLKTAFGIKK